MSLLGKAKQDARAAERLAREKASEARTKAGQDARAAERAAKQKARELRRQAREESSGRTAGNVESPDSTREIFTMAGGAAELRSPVDATLDPGPDGPGMEQFTSGGLDFSGGTSGNEDSTDVGAGLDFGFGDSDDDDLGVGVGLDFGDGDESGGDLL